MEEGPVKPYIPPASPTITATFAARYEGDCRRCDLPIYLGETIHRLSDDSYVHEGCE